MKSKSRDGLAAKGLFDMGVPKCDFPIFFVRKESVTSPKTECGGG